MTLIGGKPVAKVIDFSVAKANGGKLRDESLSTQFGRAQASLVEGLAPAWQKRAATLVREQARIA